MKDLNPRNLPILYVDEEGRGPKPCSVCGQWASRFVSDFARVPHDGRCIKLTRAGGPYAYCEDHDRYSKTFDWRGQ